MGEEGSGYFDRTGDLRVAAHAVEAVDSKAAGDIFRGGYRRISGRR
ncbi:hypothetical protein AB4Y95_02270 [Arthrobacter sp. M-10]